MVPSIEFQKTPVFAAPSAESQKSRYLVNSPVVDTFSSAIRFGAKDDELSQPSRAFVKAVTSIAHLFTKHKLDFQVEVDDSDVKKIKELVANGQKVIITPNHVVIDSDPLVMMELSYRAKIPAIVMVKPSIFSSRSGQFVAKKLGFIPADSNAIEQAARILNERKHALLMFPTGHCNLTSLAAGRLRTGVGKIALEGVKDGDSVVILPVGMYYNHAYGSREKTGSLKLEKIIRTLERELKSKKDFKNILPADFGKGSLSERAQALLSILISERIRRYNVPVGKFTTQEPTEQISEIINILLKQIELSHQKEGIEKPRRIRHNMKNVAENWRILVDLECLLDYTWIPMDWDDTNQLIELCEKLERDLLMEHINSSFARKTTVHLKLGQPIVVTGEQKEYEPLISEVQRQIQYAIFQAAESAKNLKNIEFA